MLWMEKRCGEKCPSCIKKSRLEKGGFLLKESIWTFAKVLFLTFAALPNIWC